MTFSFGNKFRIQLFGESHGQCIGVTIDGCPPGLMMDTSRIQSELDKRRPGTSELASSRKESDQIRIHSGIFDGKTTGAPLTMAISNEDVDSSTYYQMKGFLRPGHADYTAMLKYEGHNDFRGGGVFSGRMTAALVMAGSVAKSVIESSDIEILAHVVQIGNVDLKTSPSDQDIRERRYSNHVRCADEETSLLMANEIREAKRDGDSIGGVIECKILGLPAGLGEPFFDSVESVMSHMMFSIPGVKGIEFGAGFRAAKMRGSDHNDSPIIKDDQVAWSKNDAGGILGGITNGAPVIFRVPFKPTPTISKAQDTVDLRDMKEVTLRGKGRHDPCIVPRAVPVVECCAAIVMADFLKMNKY